MTVFRGDVIEPRGSRVGVGPVICTRWRTFIVPRSPARRGSLTFRREVSRLPTKFKCRLSGKLVPRTSLITSRPSSPGSRRGRVTVHPRRRITLKVLFTETRRSGGRFRVATPSRLKLSSRPCSPRSRRNTRMGRGQHIEIPFLIIRLSVTLTAVWRRPTPVVRSSPRRTRVISRVRLNFISSLWGRRCDRDRRDTF